MNDYVLIGKFVNTFGIKGELKLSSDFEYIDKALKGDLYIGVNKIKEEVNTYRIHKGYYMVLLKDYNNINEILKYKGENVYVKYADLNLSDNEYLYNELIGFEVVDNDKVIGIVIDYEKTINNVLLKVKGDKTFYIPNIDKYIINISKKDKKIITNKGSELII